MKTGLDVGLSNIHIVESVKGKIIRKKSYEKNKMDIIINGDVFFSGDMNYFIEGYSLVDELEAIWKGGIYCSRKKGIVISCGTGTCAVYEARHITGSSIGGGTIEGLCRVLLSRSVRAIDEMAMKGDIRKVDFVLKDLSKESIGRLKKDSSISHMAKLEKQTDKNDAALGILNMVGQNIANISYLAAKLTGQQNIILIGKVMDFKVIRTIIKKRIRLFDDKLNIIIPKDHEFATAIGLIK